MIIIKLIEDTANKNMWKNAIKRFLYLVFIYACALGAYITVQEFYVENCTLRGGFMNLFVSMPMCSYANKIMEMLSQQFISMFLALMGVILAYKI